MAQKPARPEVHGRRLHVRLPLLRLYPRLRRLRRLYSRSVRASGEGRGVCAVQARPAQVGRHPRGSTSLPFLLLPLLLFLLLLQPDSLLELLVVLPLQPDALDVDVGELRLMGLEHAERLGVLLLVLLHIGDLVGDFRTRFSRLVQHHIGLLERLANVSDHFRSEVRLVHEGHLKAGEDASHRQVSRPRISQAHLPQVRAMPLLDRDYFPEDVLLLQQHAELLRSVDHEVIRVLVQPLRHASSERLPLRLPLLVPRQDALFLHLVEPLKDMKGLELLVPLLPLAPLRLLQDLERLAEFRLLVEILLLLVVHAGVEARRHIGLIHVFRHRRGKRNGAHTGCEPRPSCLGAGRGGKVLTSWRTRVLHSSLLPQHGLKLLRVS
mmetsp:Transcript_23595/g.76872  ORF Transcript_23595/g.76872 Transcript_23595/m.76872 type:complete len:380 (-) Transcript_23595:183-1322(-)